VTNIAALQILTVLNLLLKSFWVVARRQFLVYNHFTFYFLPKTLKMGQTSVPETLVIHKKLTPGYNPKTFKQHYDHGGSLQLHICVKFVRYDIKDLHSHLTMSVITDLQKRYS
jgi:hypothetical protein